MECDRDRAPQNLRQGARRGSDPGPTARCARDSWGGKAQWVTGHSGLSVCRAGKGCVGRGLEPGCPGPLTRAVGVRGRLGLPGWGVLSVSQDTVEPGCSGCHCARPVPPRAHRVTVAAVLYPEAPGVAAVSHTPGLTGLRTLVPSRAPPARPHLGLRAGPFWPPTPLLSRPEEDAAIPITVPGRLPVSLAGHPVVAAQAAAVQAAAAQAAVAAQAAALEQLREKLESGEPPEKKMALVADEQHRLMQRALQQNFLAMTAQLPMSIRINSQGTNPAPRPSVPPARVTGKGLVVNLCKECLQINKKKER